MNFDILISSFKRPSVLENCLESIVRAKSEFTFNVFVLTESQDTESIKIINTLKSKLRITIIEVDQIPTPGASRNILIKSSSSPFIFFLDDDATLPETYFSTFFEKDLDFDILGGPDGTNQKTIDQNILALVLASKWVMGPTSARHRKNDNYKVIDADETILTSCHLWIRRQFILENDISFPEDLGRCEENIFITQLLASGAKAILRTDIVVYHQRREGGLKQANIQFKSGYFRGLIMAKNKEMFKSFFYIPLMTGAYLIFIYAFPRFLTFFLIKLHLVLCVILSVENVLKLGSLKAFFKTWYYITIIHIFFSIGIFFGFVKGRILKSGHS